MSVPRCHYPEFRRRPKPKTPSVPSRCAFRPERLPISRSIGCGSRLREVSASWKSRRAGDPLGGRSLGGSGRGSHACEPPTQVLRSWSLTHGTIRARLGARFSKCSPRQALAFGSVGSTQPGADTSEVFGRLVRRVHPLGKHTPAAMPIGPLDVVVRSFVAVGRRDLRRSKNRMRRTRWVRIPWFGA